MSVCIPLLPPPPSSSCAQKKNMYKEYCCRPTGLNRRRHRWSPLREFVESCYILYSVSLASSSSSSTHFCIISFFVFAPVGNSCIFSYSKFIQRAYTAAQLTVHSFVRICVYGWNRVRRQMFECIRIIRRVWIEKCMLVLDLRLHLLNRPFVWVWVCLCIILCKRSLLTSVCRHIHLHTEHK